MITVRPIKEHEREMIRERIDLYRSVRTAFSWDSHYAVWVGALVLGSGACYLGFRNVESLTIAVGMILVGVTLLGFGIFAAACWTAQISWSNRRIRLYNQAMQVGEVVDLFIRVRRVWSVASYDEDEPAVLMEVDEEWYLYFNRTDDEILLYDEEKKMHFVTDIITAVMSSRRDVCIYANALRSMLDCPSCKVRPFIECIERKEMVEAELPEEWPVVRPGETDGVALLRKSELPEIWRKCVEATG